MKTLLPLLLSLPLSVSAQSMPELLKQMPEGTITLLTHNNVLDMIDMNESLMKAEVQNRLGGQSILEQITPDFAQIRTTPSSTVCTKLLKVKPNDNIICCVNTVFLNDSIGESSLRFFSTSWTPLQTKKYIKMPTATDSFNSFVLSAESCDLIVKQTLPPAPTFDCETAKEPIKPIVYTWSNGKYKRN